MVSISHFLINYFEIDALQSQLKKKKKKTSDLRIETSLIKHFLWFGPTVQALPFFSDPSLFI